MIIVLFGIIVGAVLGALALRLAAQKSSLLGWIVLGFGALALVSIIPTLVAIMKPLTDTFHPIFSILFGTACMVSGIGAVVTHRYRQWPIWLGLGFGGVPVLF